MAQAGARCGGCPAGPAAARPHNRRPAERPRPRPREEPPRAERSRAGRPARPAPARHWLGAAGRIADSAVLPGPAAPTAAAPPPPRSRGATIGAAARSGAGGRARSLPGSFVLLNAAALPVQQQNADEISKVTSVTCCLWGSEQPSSFAPSDCGWGTGNNTRVHREHSEAKHSTYGENMFYHISDYSKEALVILPFQHPVTRAAFKKQNRLLMVGA